MGVSRTHAHAQTHTTTCVCYFKVLYLTHLLEKIAIHKQTNKTILKSESKILKFEQKIENSENMSPSIRFFDNRILWLKLSIFSLSFLLSSLLFRILWDKRKTCKKPKLLWSMEDLSGDYHFVVTVDFRSSWQETVKLLLQASRDHTWTPVTPHMFSMCESDLSSGTLQISGCVRLCVCVPVFPTESDLIWGGEVGVILFNWYNITYIMSLNINKYYWI